VHAYLLVGPPGTGKRAAATSFAAALLCSADPPDGTCESCRRVLAGMHPDVISVEREGAAISIYAARDVIRAAAMSPVEGGRKVVVLHDFHLVRDTGPALLKTIEEPPPTTVFVILAEQVPPELVTIASRCVQVDFDQLTADQVAGALEAEGVPADRAGQLAEASGGRLDRARLLAGDAQFEARRQAWRVIPARLDGSGATAAVLADELVGFLEASVEPLKSRHATEMADLVERNRRNAEVVGSGGGRGAKGRTGAGGRASRASSQAGVKELEERHKREQRRQRTDELRAGLAALAGAYRERLVASVNTDPPGRAAAIKAVQEVDKLSRDLAYNPGELLAIQAMLVRLGSRR
jgi:DNA polymerase-3 subunit delta'